MSLTLAMALWNYYDLHARHESIVEIDLVKILDEIAYHIVNRSSLHQCSSRVNIFCWYRSTNQAMQTSRERYQVWTTIDVLPATCPGCPKYNSSTSFLPHSEWPCLIIQMMPAHFHCPPLRSLCQLSDSATPMTVVSAISMQENYLGERLFYYA